jgi:WD40 repeat protein
MLQYIESFSGHEEDRVWHISWSPNGMFMASCGEDKVIRIWEFDITKNFMQCISTLEDAQSRTIRSCEWSPDGKLISSASFDGTVGSYSLRVIEIIVILFQYFIVVWEAQNSSKRNWDQIATLEGHDNEVKSVAWNCDGSRLGTCGRDKKVWIWERLIDMDFECVTVLEGHTQDVKFIKWHPKEQILFSCSYDDTIRIWKDDLDDDWFCLQVLNGHISTVWGLTISDEGDRMISCSGDNSLIVWESDDGRWIANPRQTTHLKDVHEYSIYTIDWNHQYDYIATGGGDNNITLLKVKRIMGVGFDLEIVHRTVNAHDGDINCVRWNPSPNHNHIIASVSDDGLIKLWQLDL